MKADMVASVHAKLSANDNFGQNLEIFNEHQRHHPERYLFAKAIYVFHELLHD